MFYSLADMLDQSHPLYRLADKIDWHRFEEAFTPLYSHGMGAPAKDIRLMCGLLILKHVRNLSDESVVEQWSENAYYQYFCGMDTFSPGQPCASTELVHFRHRIGESGVELILAESIRVNDDHDDKGTFETGLIDSTVQEKNVTYPTDAKLLKKVIGKIKKIVETEGLPMRRSYTRKLKAIYRDQRLRNHPRNHKKAKKADRELRTIAGRLLRELQRNLNGNHSYDEQISIFIKVVNQKKNDKDKIYSIHEPEVQCISKGKEHKKYEFGNKVSVIRSLGGLILGALSFRNEYDGYRGKKESAGTKILIPDIPKVTDSYYKKRKKRKLFCKRAGIEPTIGHLKSDFRLGRNFYKGVFGDNINIMLAAAAYNFRRAMRLLLRLIRSLELWLETPDLTTIQSQFHPCAIYSENRMTF